MITELMNSLHSDVAMGMAVIGVTVLAGLRALNNNSLTARQLKAKEINIELTRDLPGIYSNHQ